MNRRIVFAGIAGAAVVVALLAAGGIALAVVQGQFPPDDSGTGSPVAAASPRPTLTPDPGQTAVPGSLPMSERLRPWRSGDRLVTEQQLRDFHATLPTADVGGASFEKLLQTNLYDVACMKKAGFYWDPRVDPRFGAQNLSWNGVDPAARVALRGKPQGGSYDWRLGGCDGKGAHLSGIDGGPGVPGTVFPGYTPPAG